MGPFKVLTTLLDSKPQIAVLLASSGGFTPTNTASLSSGSSLPMQCSRPTLVFTPSAHFVCPLSCFWLKAVLLVLTTWPFGPLSRSTAVKATQGAFFLFGTCIFAEGQAFLSSQGLPLYFCFLMEPFKVSLFVARSFSSATSH